jgi:hypothetical protein
MATLESAHQRLHGALARLHRLLRQLCQWAQDAADCTTEGARDARHQLLNHLGRALGAHGLKLLRGVGLIGRELRCGVGGPDSTLEVSFGAARDIAGHAEVAGGIESPECTTNR